MALKLKTFVTSVSTPLHRARPIMIDGGRPTRSMLELMSISSIISVSSPSGAGSSDTVVVIA